MIKLSIIPSYNPYYALYTCPIYLLCCLNLGQMHSLWQYSRGQDNLNVLFTQATADAIHTYAAILPAKTHGAILQRGVNSCSCYILINK